MSGKLCALEVLKWGEDLMLQPRRLVITMTQAWKHRETAIRSLSQHCIHAGVTESDTDKHEPCGMLWRTNQPRVRQLRSVANVRVSVHSRLNSFSTHPPPAPRSNPSHPVEVPAVRHNRLLGYGTSYPQYQLTGGAQVEVRGLVRSIRKQKKFAFVHISDGTTLEPLQAFLHAEQAKNLTNGSYVELIGKWEESPAAGQANELVVTEVKHVGPSDPEVNPIQKQQQTSDYLRTIPHLRMRTAFQSLLARTRNKMIQSVTTHFNNDSNPLVQVHPPLITSSDCEGAGEAFSISPRTVSAPTATTPQNSPKQEKSYFGSPKYLTVSSQLHLEAYSAELGDVWTLSPTFRAEESDTTRHLSEFYMLEAEYRGIPRLMLLQKHVERLIKHVTKELMFDRTGKELLAYYSSRSSDDFPDPPDLRARWSALLTTWQTLTYTEVIGALQNAHETSNSTLFEHPPSWDNGLQLEHEKWAVTHLAANTPLFITHYPASIKPFYMLPSDPDFEVFKPTVACFDLLLPYGYAEVVGGSMREHRLEKLISNMREKGLLKKSDASEKQTYPGLQNGETLGNLQWYADLRRFGSSPHGGFGLGFDRLLAYLTGVSNVRDVVAFPRTWGRAEC